MQLFVKCKTCQRPLGIANEAAVRAQLPEYFTLKCTYADCPMHDRIQYFESHDAQAASGGAGTVGGALMVGVLGALLGGPLGLLLGGAVGGGVGRAIDTDDVRAAARFNAS